MSGLRSRAHFRTANLARLASVASLVLRPTCFTGCTKTITFAVAIDVVAVATVTAILRTNDDGLRMEERGWQRWCPRQLLSLLMLLLMLLWWLLLVFREKWWQHGGWSDC